MLCRLFADCGINEICGPDLHCSGTGYKKFEALEKTRAELRAKWMTENAKTSLT